MTVILSPSPSSWSFSRVSPTLKPGTGSGKPFKSSKVFGTASWSSDGMFFCSFKWGSTLPHPVFGQSLMLFNLLGRGTFYRLFLCSNGTGSQYKQKK